MMTRASKPARRLPAFGLATVFALLPVVSPTVGAAGGGISYEEYARNFPPMPVALTAELRDGTPRLCWTAPDHPTGGQLAYDPVIAEYRIYFIDRENSPMPIGETADTCFHDTAAPPGTLRRYVVTTVQRSGQESSWSEMLRIRVP